MAVNTTLESTDEMNDLINLDRSGNDYKPLPKPKQDKFNELCQAQFTVKYPKVLKKVRKELINI